MVAERAKRGKRVEFEERVGRASEMEHRLQRVLFPGYWSGATVVAHSLEIDRELHFAAQLRELLVRVRGRENLEPTANGAGYTLSRVVLGPAQQLLIDLYRDLSAARHVGNGSSVSGQCGGPAFLPMTVRHRLCHDVAAR